MPSTLQTCVIGSGGERCTSTSTGMLRWCSGSFGKRFRIAVDGLHDPYRNPEHAPSRTGLGDQGCRRVTVQPDPRGV